MKENQHNDNLERFFKANLERYSPTPSPDFWERMEPAIPPRPSAWARWATAAKRWGGLALLLLSLATVTVLWRSDRAKLARLTKTVAVQQKQIEQLGELSKAFGEVSATEPVAVDAGNPTTQNAPKSVVTAEANAPILTQKTPATREESKLGKMATLPKNTAKPAAPVAFSRAVSGEKMVEPLSVENQKSGLPPAAEPSIPDDNFERQSTQLHQEASRPHLETPVLIALGNPSFLPRKNVVLPIKFRTPRPSYKSYPRFSVESGASVFGVPLGSLFAGDTLYTGRVRPSYAVGMLFTFDMNRAVSFQAGYQFKDLRSARMSLRYNSFPFLLRKQWGWGRRTRVELKSGLVINSLLSARTATDGLSVRGLRNTWLGYQGGVCLVYRMSERLSLVTGPTVGYSLTPIANNRRIWDAGLGANLRYRFW